MKASKGYIEFQIPGLQSETLFHKLKTMRQNTTLRFLPQHPSKELGEKIALTMWKNCREPQCTVGGSAKWCSLHRNSMEALQKIKNKIMI